MPTPPSSARTHFEAIDRSCNKSNKFHQCRLCLAAARLALRVGASSVLVEDIRARKGILKPISRTAATVQAGQNRAHKNFDRTVDMMTSVNCHRCRLENNPRSPTTSLSALIPA
ncbi:hypothetical protein F444_12759 [Phytophthora nicotianae P1976]|uniref:Uncharacterized protein n=1 Tax=Phytophthora nicotianae P1976 TaxID=1317066 RepID=A0A080ZVZ6_PHYNI|nr:hypothetical protein F444_12759 [Phytophthora nicotianae P1976]